MNFSNNAAIATLKVINDRMDYLSNEVEDRSYDELMELNHLGEMREQLERETFIDFMVKGKQETDSISNIKLNGERRVADFESCHFADPTAAKVCHLCIVFQLTETGLISEDIAKNYATLLTESQFVQYAKGEAA